MIGRRSCDQPRSVARTERERVLVQPVLDGLFLLTILTVTFHSCSGARRVTDAVRRAHVRVPRAVRMGSHREGRRRFTRTAMVAFVFFPLFALVYLAGFYNLDTGQALAQWAKGMVKFVLHFGFLVAGIALLARASIRFYWYALAAFLGGIGLNAVYGVVQLVLAERRDQPRRGPHRADHVAADRDQRLRRGRRDAGGVPAQRADGRSNHLGIELVIPLLVLTPLYLRLEAGAPAEDAARDLARVPARRRARDALAERAARARVRRAVLALPYRRHLRRPAFLVPLGAVAVLVDRRDRRAARLLPDRAARPHEHEPRGPRPTSRSTRSSPTSSRRTRSSARAEQLRRLLRVRHGPADFGPHSFYVATIVETGIVGAALFAASSSGSSAGSGRATDRARAIRRRRPARRAFRPWPGDDRRARRDPRRERLLPHDDLLLLLRVRDARPALPWSPSARAANGGRRPHDVVPARAGRRRRGLRSRRRRAPAGGRRRRRGGLARDRSATSGSRTGTGSSGT